MNKDVIYIEPEDDITDIIAKVKNAKTKIVALVPPKKAGVLRSVVNFKLIAKTALQHNKTVVLISTDENLVKFAQSVKMPVAKSLSSKPQLATDDEAEFGDADEESDIIEEEPEPETSTSKSEKKDVKSDHEKFHKDDKKAEVVKAKKSEEVVTEDEIDEEADTDKKVAKKKTNQKVPNIKKYRTQIIIGSVFAVIMVVVLVWAFAFAPAAKVVVHVRTSDQGFSETIKLTTDQDKEDIDAGIFYMEEKAIEKTASADFEATGEVDKGTKASGTLTIKRTSPVSIVGNGRDAITIPVGTKFTYNGLTYVSTAASTLRAVDGKDFDTDTCKVSTSLVATCDLAKDVTTTVKIEAIENGDKYNMGAVNSGWTASISGATPTSSAAISGGTSKIVKIVSEDDLAAAEENLDITGESDAKKELIDENSDDAIVIKSSFNIENGQLSSSPALGEEVNGDTKPKVTKKTTYKVYTVSRDAVSQYIEKTVEEGLGDDTRTVYATGAGKDEEKVIAFFESYKNNNGEYTAKLKSTVKIGPRVTPEMISEKILGQKVGQVRTMLTSINGVADVEINRSYFWVTKIPSDINKVEIEITVD
jgi:hypothetical protein